MSGFLVLFVALIADRKFGEPDFLWLRLPHPVVLFGGAVNYMDGRFNLETEGDGLRYRKGALCIVVLVVGALLLGAFLNWLFALFGPVQWLFETIAVFVLLAQKSLIDHVSAVSNGLREGGLREGRKAVAMIVGRNPDGLDRSGVSRAAIETLGENFSDGVIAPAFWYLIFGLPGMIAYKLINTADSMIGYRSTRYEYFGKTAAQLDDLANWLPARLSALIIAAAALLKNGPASARRSLAVALGDAGLHRSPNAGWPEAALAGACHFALGGPRSYSGETVAQAYLNASGRQELDAAEIDQAVAVIAMACTVIAAMALLAWLVF